MALFDDLKKKVHDLTAPTKFPPPLNPMPGTPGGAVPAEPVNGQSQAANANNQAGILTPELETLLNSAIINGQISEKSRAVLHKRAILQGVDPDELDLIIDARLAKMRPQVPQPAIQQAPQAPARPVPTPSPLQQQRNANKCPHCGAQLPSFSTHCPDCGTELRGIKASQGVQGLFDMLQQIDEEHLAKQDRSVVGQLIDLSSRILLDSTSDDQISYNRKVTVIKTYPVPTTKEDILEFLALGVPLGKKPSMFGGAPDDRIRQAWREKCQQVIIKGRLLMKNEADIQMELNRYEAELLNKKFKQK